MSGYVHCACRDCFEIAIASEGETKALCWECEEAGCSADGDKGCDVATAYGVEEEQGYTLECSAQCGVHVLVWTPRPESKRQGDPCSECGAPLILQVEP